MSFSRRVSLLGLVLALAMSGGYGEAGDWLRFRGPNGSGISSDTTPLPTKWSPTENLKWKVKLPGPGSSCPIIVGEKIFLTCWTGYGVGGGSTGDQKNLRRHLLCLDRKTGKTLWDKSIDPELPESRYGGMFAQNGYATHTPVSDGKKVFVFFGKTGVLAFDLDGKKLWQSSVGTGLDRRNWGSASSPVLYKDLVIITASPESEALVALNKETGKQVWKAEARGFASTWGTPVLVEVDKNRTDLVLGVPGEIWGFNPDTGKLRWYCECTNDESYCSSVVADHGIVYGIEGRSGGSIAVKAGGFGEITKTNVVWSGSDRNRIGTPVVVDGRIYFVYSGTLNCNDAKTGKSIYKQRMTSSAGGGRGFGGQDYSSPVVGDGKLYYTSRSGTVTVVKLGEKYERLAVNQVTKESEDFSATPAISDGELFLRSSKHLYCIANSK